MSKPSGGSHSEVPREKCRHTAAAIVCRARLEGTAERPPRSTTVCLCATVAQDHQGGFDDLARSFCTPLPLLNTCRHGSFFARPLNTSGNITKFKHNGPLTHTRLRPHTMTTMPATLVPRRVMALSPLLTPSPAMRPKSAELAAELAEFACTSRFGVKIRPIRKMSAWRQGVRSIA